MKTENTLENKAKFFAQYWGQYVSGIIGAGRTKRLGEEIPLNLSAYLQLTALSLITDEDAIEVAKIRSYSDLFTGKEIVKYIDNGNYEVTIKFWPSEIIAITDFLRSKGYALPWMDLSVKGLIAYGWIKLTE
jgi:hypothetical protein